MFGLPEQIGGAHFGVGGVVSDDQGFGGAGQQVDTDATKELALGLGHECVTGANQHIDRRDGLGAKAHSGDCLDAAEQIYFIGTAEGHGGDGGGGRYAVQRRGAGGDAGHTGHFRGQHGHMCRGHHRVAAAGHVAADTGDRDVFVAQPDSGQGFDFDIDQGCLLRFGETAYLRLGEFDVLDDLVRQAVHQGGDLVRAQAERFRFPFVEFGRQFAHGGVAAGGDILEDGFNGMAHLPIVFRFFRFRRALFQYLDHRLTPPSNRRRRPARSP